MIFPDYPKQVYAIFPKDEFGNYIVEEAKNYPPGWEGNFEIQGSGSPVQGSGNLEKKDEDYWWLD